MKHHLSLYCCLGLLLFFGCKSLQNGFSTKKRGEGQDYFEVLILQNGKVVKPENGIFHLKKAPFKFRIGFIKTENVYVSTSWGKYYYDYPLEENIFECNGEGTFGVEGCRFVAIKTGFGDAFNKGENIFVGDGSYQAAWFYEEDLDWHRFDEGGIEVSNGIVYGTRTVKHIYDCDKRDQRIYPESEYNYGIKEIDQDIYVVMATDHYEKGMEHPDELQRERFILRFR